MIQTSEAYAPFAQVRQVDCLISFEVLAKTLNKKNIVVTAPSAVLGNGAATINGMPELAAKYGTLERYGWPLDGSCSVMPSSGIETGFWSSAVSDDAGGFSSPLVFRYDLPSDTDTFGWTFHFDAPAMITASLVKAVCYDAGGGVIDTAEGYVEGTVDPPRPTITVGIEPVQDLNGYDKPWSAGGGKNKLSLASISLGGTEPRTKRVEIAPISAGTYKISGINTGTATTRFGFQFFDAISGGNKVGDCTPSSAGANLTLSGTAISVYAYMSSADYSDGKTVILNNLQIESGSTVTSYAPYSNICPITGWTGANIYVSPTDDPADGRTYSVAFPTEAGTVYGGTLDVTSGVLTVDRAMIASYAGKALPSGWISDRDVYAAGTAPTIGAQVVYELATPVTYQLPPVEISRILDTDNVWADCGPVLEIGTVPGNRQEIKKTSAGWSFAHYVHGYRAVEFTFYGTNGPLRMLRLAEVDFGVSKHFNRESIQSARIKYGMAPDGSAFPAKQIVFTFDNSNGEFNVLSPEGVYQYWRNGQVLTARIKVGDEIVPMGMFYVTKAEIGDNRLLAKVTAHDPCYQLANQKFYPSALAEQETVRLDEAVTRALYGTDFEVDYGGLEDELVSVAVRDTHDKRTILRYLAQAARATCWFDRDNVLRFRRIETAEEEIGSITADELYGWSGVSIAEEYTGVTLTVHRELQEGGEGGGDPTEEYHAGITEDTGTAVASYDNPCVAAVNGQAVADWLFSMANRRKKYAVKNRCDPAVELGDTLVIADAFRNDDRAVVTGLDIEYNGGLSCTTDADREF